MTSYFRRTSMRRGFRIACIFPCIGLEAMLAFIVVKFPLLVERTGLVSAAFVREQRWVLFSRPVERPSMQSVEVYRLISVLVFAEHVFMTFLFINSLTIVTFIMLYITSVPLPDGRKREETQ